MSTLWPYLVMSFCAAVSAFFEFKMPASKLQRWASIFAPIAWLFCGWLSRDGKANWLNWLAAALFSLTVPAAVMKYRKWRSSQA